MVRLNKNPEFDFSEGFRFAVASGRIPGYSYISKFGVNQTIIEGIKADLWDFGGVYTFDPYGNAPIKYLSSSSNLDRQTIVVEGLDINGYFTRQFSQLNGLNVVVLNTPLWRVYRMYNFANYTDVSTSFVGKVYCHTSATVTNGIPPTPSVRATCDDGKNQTLMAIYTIPRGKVGFLYQAEGGMQLQGVSISTLSNYIHFHFETRNFMKVFRVQKAITCVLGGNSNYQNQRAFPDPLPAMTDVRVRAEEVSEDMGAWAAFDIMLVDESVFSHEFLNSINQPFN